MNSLTETIKNELKNMKNRKISNKEPQIIIGQDAPKNQECSAIPCAYLGIAEEVQEKIHYLPNDLECASIPCAYLGIKEKKCR